MGSYIVDPYYVICRGASWAKNKPRMVRLIRKLREVVISDTTIYEVEDVMTGDIHEVEDYYLYMDTIYNEIEAIAWAAL